MAKIEQNLGVDSKELLFPDDWMEELRKQAEEKQRAKESPTRLDVSGKPFKLWNKDWKYFGSWLRWWKINMDCPWWWEWIFKSTDGKVEARWLWNKDGTFVGKSVNVNWKSFTNNKTIYETGNPSKISSRICSSTVNWYTYDCKLNKDFEISEITYAWITLKLKHESGNVYLINEWWHKLKLGGVAEDLASLSITALQ